VGCRAAAAAAVPTTTAAAHTTTTTTTTTTTCLSVALILEEIAIDSHHADTETRLLDEARELHLSSLLLAMRAFGENNVQTAKHYGNLGRLYQSMHKFDVSSVDFHFALRCDVLGCTGCGLLRSMMPASVSLSCGFTRLCCADMAVGNEVLSGVRTLWGCSRWGC